MTKKKFKGNEKTKQRKRAFYEALQKTLGNISLASEKTGIDRTTHYHWLKKDEAYKQLTDQITEITHDFVENKLLEKIENGDTTATIFYLKTKAKNRGYTEKQEVQHSGNIDKNIDKVQVEVIRPNDNNDNSETQDN